MSTEQTNAPLERMHASTGQESIFQISQASTELILNAPFQRGSVWGERRQRNLVRSMLLGIPTGTIFVNERPDFTDALVDGKQRVEAIRAFLSSVLAVPASWFPSEDIETTEETTDGPFVRFSGLTDRGRGRFNRCGVVIQRTQLPTIEEEEDLFDLINFGGVPQGESDL